MVVAAAAGFVHGDKTTHSRTYKGRHSPAPTVSICFEPTSLHVTVCLTRSGRLTHALVVSFPPPNPPHPPAPHPPAHFSTRAVFILSSSHSFLLSTLLLSPLSHLLQHSHPPPPPFLLLPFHTCTSSPPHPHHRAPSFHPRALFLFIVHTNQGYGLLCSDH